MAWTSLTFSYGAILTSAQMTQMYDNFAAMAAASAGAPVITGFVKNDIGSSLGVGTAYTSTVASGTVVPGATVAGSSLNGAFLTGATGTWRNIGASTASVSVNGLFQRIS